MFALAPNALPSIRKVCAFSEHRIRARAWGDADLPPPIDPFVLLLLLLLQDLLTKTGVVSHSGFILVALGIPPDSLGSAEYGNDRLLGRTSEFLGAAENCPGVLPRPKNHQEIGLSPPHQLGHPRPASGRTPSQAIM